MKIIDAKNAVLGRLATYTAKHLLSGEEVIIINAERAIITGNKEVTAKKYMKYRIIGSPQSGPFYPRMPDRIVKRSVRGMLPKNRKGVRALKLLRVHIGAPPGICAGKEAINIAQKEIKSDYITITELARRLGWRGA
jgi:large subunit ribosomal protein L13